MNHTTEFLAFLAVGCGGFLGACARYLISLLPISIHFPIATLLTNFFGAVLIGLITGIVLVGNLISPYWVLFLKTGICGGFTTFSTFSLEAVTLLEQGRWKSGVLYMILSLSLCLFGVWIGKELGTHVFLSAKR